MTQRVEIRVYVDDGEGSILRKEDCLYKDIIYDVREDGTGRGKITFTQFKHKIKREFGQEIPDILKDDPLANITWKVLSYKDACSELEDHSRDVEITSDENLNDEFDDNSDSDDSESEGQNPKEKRISVL
ncbi:hypothetical protein RFI_23649, partial [Reticulomyxa filosa]